MNEPVGPLANHIASDAGLPTGVRPLVFPTLDDQAAGLIGGGAVEAGHVAIILGNSAVVNSSSAKLPQSGTLDAMKLNWGPYLWMRCYSNGAQFLDEVAGERLVQGRSEAATRAAAVRRRERAAVPPFGAVRRRRDRRGWSGARPSRRAAR